MQRYSRKNKIAYQLSEAKYHGKQSEIIYLFPSEQKKLQKDGYTIIPLSNSKLSIPCEVSWPK